MDREHAEVAVDRRSRVSSMTKGINPYRFLLQMSNLGQMNPIGFPQEEQEDLISEGHKMAARKRWNFAMKKFMNCLWIFFL